MKLIIAIINGDDVNSVVNSLTRSGFSATRLSTMGGFLMAKNVTILVGVDEEKVPVVLDIIKAHSHSRRQAVPSSTAASFGYPMGQPVEVNVGGATIFVVDVEQFQRI